MWGNRLPLRVEAAFAKRRCVVCGDPIGATIHDSHACRRPSCRGRFLLLRGNPPEIVRWASQLPRCSVCRWPLTPDEARRSNSTCSMQACREEAERRHRAEEEARDAAREERNAALYAWGAEAVGLGAEGRERTRLVVIPSQPQILEPLPEEQREAFANHVKEVIERAFAQPPSRAVPEEPAPVDPRVERLRDLGCATCKGHCCVAGARHAFIDVEEVARLRAARPGMKPREVEAYYLDVLPRLSVRGSCPYSTEGGCSLGERRSRTCKGYHCPPLTDVGDAVPVGDAALMVAIDVRWPVFYAPVDWPSEGAAPVRAELVEAAPEPQE